MSYHRHKSREFALQMLFEWDMAQKDPAQVNIDKIQERLNSPDYARVVQSLRDVGLGTAVGMMSVYSGQDSDLKPWLQGAEINGDWNLRLQYLAGLAVNNSKEGQIYSEILNYRKFPANLITGSPQMLQQLEAAIQAGGQ